MFQSISSIICWVIVVSYQPYFSGSPTLTLYIKDYIHAQLCWGEIAASCIKKTFRTVRLRHMNLHMLFRTPGALCGQAHFCFLTSNLYTNTVLDGSVTLSVILSVCAFAIETTFPLSNFKTKHIFGILMTLQTFLKLWAPQAPIAAGARNMGHHRRPRFLFLFSFTVAEGGGKRAPKAPLSRRAREIPPKAGVSQVYIYTYICLYKINYYLRTVGNVIKYVVFLWVKRWRLVCNYCIHIDWKQNYLTQIILLFMIVCFAYLCPVIKWLLTRLYACMLMIIIVCFFLYRFNLHT